MKKYKGVLPVFPEGWYVVALTSELKKGEVISRKFSGDEVVVFRTESGKIAVMDAYCKHMGAHLGHGGTIEGETIRCPFHGFCFNTDGECTKTSYGTPPSPRLPTFSYAVKEMHGVILAYYHPKRLAPTWEVEDLNLDQWSPLTFKEWIIESHPQETAENAVDVGHFAAVHNYESVRTIVPMEGNGPLLTATYGMKRPAGLGKRAKKTSKPVDVEFDIVKYGFGYSVVEAHTKTLGLYSRHFVFSCPIDGNKMYLRIALSFKEIEDKRKINPFLAVVPEKLLRQLIQSVTFKSYQSDVLQDFDIWQNKTYIHPPALSKGDGPVMQFREWAQQFYNDIEEPVL